MGDGFERLAGRPPFTEQEWRDFDRRQRERSLPLLRLALVISAVAYFDFMTWDLYVGSPKGAIPLRIVTSALFFALLGISYLGRGDGRLGWWYGAYALLFASSLAGMLALSPLAFEERLPGILFYVVAFLALSPHFLWTVGAYLLLLATANGGMAWVGVDLAPHLIANAFLASWMVTAGAIAYYFDLRRRHDYAHERQRERERHLLRRLATVDTLTGVANRRYFLSLLKREVERSRRYGHRLSVAMLDIDHFKRINDTFGHDAGDRALKAFARVIGKRLRVSDHFGRLGGEEFALIFPETGGDEALRSVEALRLRLETMNMTLNGERLLMTMSAGVTEWRPEDAASDETLKRADVSLYRAKEGGRNRVVGDGTPEGV
ncbi:MAG: GGDEF domain-containing protein [Nitrospinae bacterium]|nr:GGDEF domain-containing protein [Nitrospinota bacterium]